MLRKRGAENAASRGPWALSNAKLSENDGEREFKTPEKREMTPTKKLHSPRIGKESFISLGGGDTVWLDAGFSSSSTIGRKDASAVLETEEPAVEAAVIKALTYMSLDKNNKPQQQTPPKSSRSPLFKFDSGSFLDKGIDAINGVGKLVEGFAVTLDNVIGQAFEDWGTPKNANRNVNRPISNRAKAPVRSTHRNQTSGSQVVPPPKAVVGEDWGDFDVDNESEFADENSAPQAPSELNVLSTKMTGTSSQAANGQCNRNKAGQDEVLQWRRRAQALQKELQRLRAHQDQYKKLKEEHDILRLDLQQTSSAVNELSAENHKLRSGSGGSASETSDPLAAEQVMRQMEALLTEKARLLQENDRLLRENNGLQELLEFTMQQQFPELDDEENFDSVHELDELGEYGDDSDCDGVAQIED